MFDVGQKVAVIETGRKGWVVEETRKFPEVCYWVRHLDYDDNDDLTKFGFYGISELRPSPR